MGDHGGYVTAAERARRAGIPQIHYLASRRIVSPCHASDGEDAVTQVLDAVTCPLCRAFIEAATAPPARKARKRKARKA